MSLIDDVKAAILASPLCRTPAARDRSAQDSLDECLAPLAAAADCVELIAQLQEVQIITRHDRSRTRVAVGTRVWYGDTLLAALRAAAQQAEGD